MPCPVYIYLLSGSAISKSSIVFSYMVNTIPPLSVSLTSRGRAPDQKVRTPSSRKILAAQTKLFLYSDRAEIDCIRVLIVSRGCVTYLINDEPLARPSRSRDVRRHFLHGNQAGHASQAKRAGCSQFLPWRHVALCGLFEGGVATKSRGRICRLAGCGGHEALEEASDTSFTRDDGGAVKKTSHARIG